MVIDDLKPGTLVKAELYGGDIKFIILEKKFGNTYSVFVVCDDYKALSLEGRVIDLPIAAIGIFQIYEHGILQEI